MATKQTEFVDQIIGDMRLDDPDLKPWDGEGGGQKELLPPGEYVFEVINVAQTVSSNGNPMLNIDYRVSSEGPCFGKVTKQRCMLMDNDGSRGRLKHLLMVLQVPLLPGGSFSTASLMGQQMIAEIAHEESKGINKKGQEVTYTNERMLKERSLEEVPAQAAPAKPKNGATAPATTATRTPVGNARPTAR